MFLIFMEVGKGFLWDLISAFTYSLRYEMWLFYSMRFCDHAILWGMGFTFSYYLRFEIEFSYALRCEIVTFYSLTFEISNTVMITFISLWDDEILILFHWDDEIELSLSHPHLLYKHSSFLRNLKKYAALSKHCSRQRKIAFDTLNTVHNASRLLWPGRLCRGMILFSPGRLTCTISRYYRCFI